LHGGYSYVDANGHVQSVKYVADPHHGFQIVSATNLPKGPSAAVAVVPTYAVPAVSHWGVPAYAALAHGQPLPVQKTPEVLAAEHKHFAAHAEAKARLHHVYRRSVPVDTPEVQHEKQIHFAAHQRALQGLPANPILYHPQLAAPAHNKWSYEPAHYNKWSYEQAPAPVNGVPVDTAEVQHAKAAHFALVADAKSKLVHSGAHYAPAHDNSWNKQSQYTGPYHYPTLTHNGVPEETHEVKAEKAKHFALVAEAQSKQAHHGYSGHEDDGSYKPEYENESYWH
jgi:hypothetical protein